PLGSTLRCFALFGGCRELCRLGFSARSYPVMSCQPFSQGKQFALERGDFSFQGFDLGKCDQRASEIVTTSSVRIANIPPPIVAVRRGPLCSAHPVPGDRARCGPLAPTSQRLP